MRTRRPYKKPRVVFHRCESPVWLDEFPERVPFQIRINRRVKRSRLVVSPEDGLILEAPRRLTVKKAREILIKKQDWVMEAMEHVRRKQERARELRPNDNGVLVFGKEKRVWLRARQKRDYIFETGASIFMGFAGNFPEQKEIRKRLEHWLRDRARRYLPMRVKQLNRGRFDIKKIVVKDQKTLWGSCTSDKSLNLNWRLIMAPQAMSDYIIYHEMCHTKHLNHSRRFWALVSEVCRNVDDAERWFRDFGFLLTMNLVKLD